METLREKEIDLKSQFFGKAEDSEYTKLNKRVDELKSMHTEDYFYDDKENQLKQDIVDSYNGKRITLDQKDNLLSRLSTAELNPEAKYFMMVTDELYDIYTQKKTRDSLPERVQLDRVRALRDFWITSLNKYSSDINRYQDNSQYRLDYISKNLDEFDKAVESNATDVDHYYYKCINNLYDSFWYSKLDIKVIREGLERLIGKLDKCSYTKFRIRGSEHADNLSEIISILEGMMFDSPAESSKMLSDAKNKAHAVENKGMIDEKETQKFNNIINRYLVIVHDTYKKDILPLKSVAYFWTNFATSGDTNLDWLIDFRFKDILDFVKFAGWINVEFSDQKLRDIWLTYFVTNMCNETTFNKWDNYRLGLSESLLKQGLITQTEFDVVVGSTRKGW